MADLTSGDIASKPPDLCSECGQPHLFNENHVYNFQDEVDDELVCHICLQPLLQPMDTPCGHTYCYRCLKNFLKEKDFCPMDRKKLCFQDCHKSSLLVRNLLDKLSVVCPFLTECKQVMQRSDLEPHLRNRCPGYRKYRGEKEKKHNPLGKEPQDAHSSPSQASGISSVLAESSLAAVVALGTSEPGLVNPAFDEHDDDQPHRTSLVAETTTVVIHRDDPEEELGMRIVGGRDTPLGNIVVQEVLKDSLVALDGKLTPGDHILEVNGLNVSNVSHSQAIALIRQPCSVLHLTVLQEKGFSQRPPQADGNNTAVPNKEVIHVTLLKRDRSEPLGIKLVRKTEETGVFVLDLLDGGLAAKDGKLRCNDKVLSINGHDLGQGTPETAAHVIQMSEARVNFVVLRQNPVQLMDVSEEGASSGSGSSSSSSNGGSPVLSRKRPSQHPCTRKSTNQKDPPPPLSGLEKVVCLKKEPRESLGITIGGGRDHKNKLPIYVSSVQPVGCLYRDGRITRGDVLLSINGTDLTSLGYLDAVSALKTNAASHNVVLKALELTGVERHGEGSEGDGEMSRERGRIWSPLWVSWLALPSCLHWCRHISLRKSSFESWGFSIVGGYEEAKGNQPFFIKTIVPATPAFFDGRLKCGDEIVEVNGLSAIGMSNAELIPMLKEQKNRVTLTVVSWPGSLV